ncbi:MAG: SAM-dependent methyltransferase [Planctomycetaceae bacterium]|nr:SAM-dependent methyltransferase [Planctomycetaceae bacterium]
MAETIVPQTTTLDVVKSGPTWLERTARKKLLEKLANLRDGGLTIIDEGQKWQLGDLSSTDCQATINVHSPRFYRRLALGGSIGVAESYVLGEWSCDDLISLVRIFIRNRELGDEIEGPLSTLGRWIARRWHEVRENSKDGSRNNIHAHYDLGNDFYSLFLDETMTYSSGIFESPESTLQEASVEKLDRICRKLDLKPTDHVCEIGTGWGGFAIHAAKTYGCRITTTTISNEQYKFASEKIKAEGLEDRITILLDDYRDLTGQFDKLVSIEMIEAVGHRYFDTYFGKCSELLKPDGMMVLQGITMSEQRYQQYLKSCDFIQRYIFPGGCLVSVTAMNESVTRSTDMRMVHLEDFAQHYAQTLNHWRQRFFDRISDVRQLGYSDNFIRLWEYYLCYCEAAFLERAVGVVQMHLAKPRCFHDVAV